jgi:hypothetical protein
MAALSIIYPAMPSIAAPGDQDAAVGSTGGSGCPLKAWLVCANGYYCFGLHRQSAVDAAIEKLKNVKLDLEQKQKVVTGCPLPQHIALSAGLGRTMHSPLQEYLPAA